MSTTSTSQSTNQPTTTLTREHLRKHLEIAGQPADEETISRILSANRSPQSAATRSTLATSRPFSLLR